MPRKRRPWTLIGLAALLSLVGCALAAGTFYALQLPENLNEQDTLVYGPSHLVPGAPGALHIRVQRHDNQKPVEGAEVEVALVAEDGGQAALLFQGTTAADGQVTAAFTVPDVARADQQIVVETRSRLGRDSLVQPVTVERSYKVLLSTDKPIYQPGQQILIRALALGAFDQRPAAGSEVRVTVADARGNKVFRQAATTSDYGIASWTFQLAGEVNHGNYKITAELGNTTSETTVVVKPYVLPKFKVTASTDEDYYQPGQRVTGIVEAAYFFGKAVEGGQVRLSGWVYDVERRQVLDLQGETDTRGQFGFEFDLPGYFVAALEGGVADFILEVAVTDTADHTEQVSSRIPVAQQGILLEAVPESGDLKPGLENIVYLLAAYPDGSPAECALTIQLNGREYSTRTGRYGLGELAVTPDSAYASLYILARDAQGHRGEAMLSLEGPYQSGSVLLRPERAAYRVGETMNLEILTGESAGSIYLDITRENQTLSTRALDVRDGRAVAAIDLTPDLYGTLSLHAYRLLPSGDVIRDTRLVVVDAAADLTLDARWDRETYLPGESANLQLQVTDGSGQGVASALGLAIVDESVFALQEQDPGFAKLYFLLEKELLQPKFDLHGLSFSELMQGIDEPALRDAKDRAGQATLAGLGGDPFTLRASSYRSKVRLAEERQARLLSGLGTTLYGLLLVLPLGVVLALGYSLWRDRVLGRSVALGIALPLTIVSWLVAILLVVQLPSAPWADTPLEKLEYLLREAGALLLCLVVPGILAGLGGAIALGVQAVRRQEWAVLLALLLSLVYGLLLPLLFVVLAAANISEPSGLTIAAFVAAYLLLPLAFGARAIGFGFQRQGWRMVSAGLAAGLLIMSISGAVLILSVSGQALGAVGEVNQAMPGADFGRGGIVVEEVGLRAPGMTATPAPQPTPVQGLDAAKGAGQDQAQSPLLRQFFPETMYWNPEAITDAGGRWQADLALAHTITTWRLTALASSQDGRLGSTTAPLRVFQDFFVDIDLPLALTQGDEVSMPVAVYNYLEAGQQVALELEAQQWFECLAEPVQTVEVAPGDVTVVYFPIKVLATEGRFRPVVTARGRTMSDATTLRHDVQVVPNGKRFDKAFSDRLGGDVQQTIMIPAEAIPGTAQIIVKIYPGILSQVVEGLEALLRMPYGCFEQTSSMTYPNVLVLDYLKSTGQSSPEVQMTAEQYINTGYQRLTTFEVPDGGFSLFGQFPADRMLTAYGLMEFSDMARVHPVDEALVERAARWLLEQQQGDGSWENDQGLVHEQSWSKLGNEGLPVTAYITWALTEAGYGDDPGAVAGLDYVREFRREGDDAYVLALVANALAAADPEDAGTRAVLDSLADLATTEGNGAYWTSGIATFMGSTGETGSIETTALAAYAFLRAGQHLDLANQALTYLVQQKDSYGTWHSTQATVLTLKALLLSVREGGEGADATVRVSLNGEEADPVRITEESFDVVQMISFSDRPLLGDNKLRISVEGEGNLTYQVSSYYYVPWDRVPVPAAEQSLMAIDVDYDRTELSVEDTIEVSVRVELKEGAARQAIVDLGVPPGFEVMGEDLADLVARHSDLPAEYEGPKVSRFDLTGRKIILYLEGLKAGQPLALSYRIRARFAIKAQTPPSAAYDYYNPAVSGVSLPVAFEVRP